jgi:hypothetical protein
MEQFEDWQIEDMVLDTVNGLAVSKLNKFYPTYVSKATSLPLDITFKYLSEMAKKGRITLSWELRCEECYRTLKTVENVIPFLNDELICKYCGEETTFNRDNIFPVFYINEAYKRQQKDNVQVKKKIALRRAITL